MPASLELNRGFCPEGTPRELAKAATGQRAGSDDEALTQLAEWTRRLNGELGIPPRLRDLKDISPDRDEILARALDDHCHRTNPRPCGESELLEMWERVW